jgi:nucleotide-binding universal stress UspA family protein
MKIVVATDGSEHSKVVAEAVANRPFPPNTEVKIVSAFESITRFMYAPLPMSGNYEEFNINAEKNANEAIEEAAAVVRVKNPDLILSTEVLCGSPKEVILEVADAFGADLIVVGSQGLGALERFLLGSVAQSVALHAKCSVEIVRQRAS